MLNRLKNLWRLSKKDSKSISDILTVSDFLPDEDTKAEFLGSGTEKEFQEQEKADKGLKGIFGL